jgi:hypothetical protein
MNYLQETAIHCPYCGEKIEILVDCSAGSQEYIEDCQVCCRPINMKVAISESDGPHVQVYRDDD